MAVQIIPPITDVEIIAVGRSINDLKRIVKLYGKGRWRKLTGKALVRTPNGAIRRAEIHWYEANGVGQKEYKVKGYLP